MSRDEVIRAIREELPELCARYGVKSLGLFGSYARDEAQITSDVDLLVEFDRTPSLYEFGELELFLSDLLAVRVDLVMRSALKPTIGLRVLAEVTPI
jgi:predicted nucleotidyltransferase